MNKQQLTQSTGEIDAFTTTGLSPGKCDCMHWGAEWDYSRTDTMRKTCPDCGASGTIPRCQGTTQKGEQCKLRALDAEHCRTHDPATPKITKPAPAICSARRKNGTPCTAYATSSGKCLFHDEVLVAARKRRKAAR